MGPRRGPGAGDLSDGSIISFEKIAGVGWIITSVNGRSTSGLGQPTVLELIKASTGVKHFTFQCTVRGATPNPDLNA